MPQVLGLFEDSSVYLNIWRNASQGRGEGTESKESRVIPLPSFLPSPGLQAGNILEAGEYMVNNETRDILLQATTFHDVVAGNHGAL